MSGQFFLIAQHDHALLSGRLAAHFGNARFGRPDPLAETLAAISMHDCGWPLHDEMPTLNKQGLPVDVFENPLPLSLRMWEAASERLVHESPYTRLLVSIHVLGLSTFAASRPHTPREIFELNRFQHREIERQVELRPLVGLATEIPLRFGLATEDTLPAERQLKHNHRILQLMDRLSLSLCCTELLFPVIDDVLPRPGQAALTITLARTGPTALRIEPWPFDEPTITLSVPYRAVPARPFADVQEFRRAYADAPIQHLELSVHAG